MSAWTWTYVKADCIPMDIACKICDSAIHELLSVWYMDKCKTFDEIIERWFKIHDEAYDYYVNECGLQPFEIEHDVLEKRLRELISKKQTFLADLELVKNGSQSLDSCLRKYKVWEDKMGEPMCYLIGNDVWVKVPEIFRLRQYSDMRIEDGIKTVDFLLNYLSEQAKDILYDFAENTGSNDGEGLTEALKSRIVEYYGRFGDGNFSVHFG